MVVEVDFRKNRNGDFVAPRPKDLTGLLLTPAAADNHTPFGEYRKRYTLGDTIIVVVTAYATDRHREFAQALFQRFHVAERGVRELFVCGGATQFLFGWPQPAPRTPISPARIATLARSSCAHPHQS